MTKFRKRIGEKGAEKIFKFSLRVNAGEISAKKMKQVLIDSTVQEKNTTFPMNAKLYRKIVERVQMLSKCEGIEQVIGHLKSYHRMMRNYLKGTFGDGINTLMAAAVYNMRHWMKKNAFFFFCLLAEDAGRSLENVLFGNVNKRACYIRFSRPLCRGALAGLTKYVRQFEGKRLVDLVLL